MYQMIRKQLMLHKALHQRDNIGRLYVMRKEERLLTSIEHAVDVLVRGGEEYIKRAKRNKLEERETAQTT